MMGKKRGGKNQESYNSGQVHTSLTLGEEARGKKQSHNVKSILTMKHLEKLAVWASGVASVPSLGASFGHKLADAGEKLAVPVDPSLITCQRCEMVLQPGFNCTIRIEKNHVKPKRRKKNSSPPTQNNVVYGCHFCSHRNGKGRTSKGYVKEVCPQKAKLHARQEAVDHKLKTVPSTEKSTRNEVKGDNSVGIPSPFISHGAVTYCPVTPVVKTDAPLLLLDSKRRKRKKAGSSKVDESGYNLAKTDELNRSGTSKRKRRKSWASLREIAENKERERNQKVANFSIPFVL